MNPAEASPLKRCATCGNIYDRAFSVIMDGREHVFDSFQCAIHALAPVCPHCQCRIIGHGVQCGGAIYCCAHCANLNAMTRLRDHD